jgi:hypothetical protein
MKSFTLKFKDKGAYPLRGKSGEPCKRKSKETFMINWPKDNAHFIATGKDDADMRKIVKTFLQDD